MHWKILQLLKHRSPAYLSGEEAARLLAVSRTAVWKNIKLLQKKGYRIESSTRRGYRLLESPDLLYPAEISEHLATSLIAAAPSLIKHHAQVGSTNTILKELAEDGAPEGTVALAEEQKQGKGRLGRSWASPFAKGLWLSILLRPAVAPQEAQNLTLLSATATAKAIAKTAPPLQPGIKWPNDLLLKGRKCCGILTELKAEADLLHYIIIGVGINVNADKKDFPEELRESATSLSLESGGVVPRVKLCSAVLQELDDSYREFLLHGPEPALEEWKRWNITLGKRVTLKTMSGIFAGTAVDLEKNGALVIEDDFGHQQSFLAGEVSLIPERKITN